MSCYIRGTSCAFSFVVFLTFVSSLSLCLIVARSYAEGVSETHEKTEAPKDDSTFSLDELVVTTSPLGTELQDFSGSASVLNASSYEGAAAQHLQDVLGDVPNLNWAAGTNRPRYFQLRGVGDYEQYEGAPNHAIGFYLDDFDLSGIGSPASLFDTTQVEVLRGPQALLFGTNALAGVIRIRSEDPSPTPTMQGEISIGSDDLFSGGLSVGGAVPGLNDRVLLRISGQHLSSDGFRENRFLDRDDTNGRDEFTGRAKARVLFSNESHFALSLLRLQFDNGYDAFSIDNSLTTQSDRPGQDAQEVSGVSGKFTTHLSNANIFSATTTALFSTQDYSYDGDWGNNPGWEPFAPYDYFSMTQRERNTISQEVRLHSDPKDHKIGEDVGYLVGGIVQRTTEDSRIDNQQDGVTYDLLQSDYSARSLAGFGQIEIPLVLRTSLTLGARGEQRAISYEDTRGADFSPSEGLWAGTASVNHKISDDTLLYGLVSRGYRGGGFNSGLAVPEERRRFEPEYLWNCEVGAKNRHKPWNLTSELSVFYARRIDQQIGVSIQNDPTDPLAFTYLTDNAARGRNLGLEYEGEWAPSQRFKLIGSVGVLSTRFTDFESLDQSLVGREAAHAPTWQYSVGPKIFMTDNLFAAIVVRGMDSFYFGESHNNKSSPTHVVNTTIGFETDRWTWTLWAKNLFDERYETRGFFFGNEPPDFTSKVYTQRGDPLQVGTTLTFRF